MGMIPNVAEDGNLLASLGQGTLDADGALLPNRLRLAVRAMFAAITLVTEWAGKGPRSSWVDGGPDATRTRQERRFAAPASLHG